MGGFTYSGYQVDFRPLDKDDLPTLYEWRADIRAFHLLRVSEEPFTYDEFQVQAEAMLQQTMTLAVVRPGERQPVGLVQAYDFNTVDRWCFVLSYMSSAHRSQRMGAEASLAFWDRLFVERRLRKIYMDVLSSNTGWLDALPGRELGFIESEGRFVQHTRVGDQYLDVFRYAIYQERWSQVRDFLLLYFRLGTESTSGTATSASAAAGEDKGSSPKAAGSTSKRGASTSRRLKLVSRFLKSNREGKIERSVGLLADNIVFDLPMTDLVTGRAEVEKLLRFRHRMIQQARDAGVPGPDITWSAPDERGDVIRLVGSAGPSGDIEQTFTFTAEDRIARYELRASNELVVGYLLSENLPLD